jgi:hypothetical protein
MWFFIYVSNKVIFMGRGFGLLWLERWIGTPTTRVWILGRDGLYTYGCIPQRFESASAEILRYIIAFIYFFIFFIFLFSKNLYVVNADAKRYIIAYIIHYNKSSMIQLPLYAEEEAEK